MYLFYVEEILGVKGDGGGWYWNILIQCAAIADVGPHSERHRFGLVGGNMQHAREPMVNNHRPLLIRICCIDVN